MKVIQQNTENEFVISREGAEKFLGYQLAIVHDYIAFTGNCHIGCAPKVSVITHGGSFSSNVLSFPATMQIPIKSFSEIIMPQLLAHKYLKPEHLADRIQTEDSKYSSLKKGDKYPAYAYMDEVIHYWDGDTKMVAFHKRDQKAWNHVTLEFFNEYVKPTL